MLRVVLTVDCERLLSFKRGNPRWGFIDRIKGRINNMIKRFRYNEKGFELVLETVQRKQFPCTMMLVGNLFKTPKKDKYVEWGYHTLNHYPLTLIKDEKMEAEVDNKWKLKSITAPLWMIEDTKNPERIFKILKKEGYTHTVYKGKDEGIKHFHKLQVKKPEIRHGIKCVSLSNVFEGNSSDEKIKMIMGEVKNNLNSDGVYMLSTHDFTHRNNKNLTRIINFLQDLESKKQIKIMRLKDVK